MHLEVRAHRVIICFLSPIELQVQLALKALESLQRILVAAYTHLPTRSLILQYRKLLLYSCSAGVAHFQKLYMLLPHSINYLYGLAVFFSCLRRILTGLFLCRQWCRCVHLPSRAGRQAQLCE